MTSAILAYTNSRGLDPDIDTVRQTLDPPRQDAPAEETSPPEWNFVPYDDSGQLPGLSTRQLAGDLTESRQYVPEWIPEADFNHNALIDNQVASSGSAAKREAAGEWGHGTMQYADSIEPVIRPGSRFSSDYFVSNPLDANEGSGDYMTATAVDPNWLGVAQEIYNKQSRQAYADLYKDLW